MLSTYKKIVTDYSYVIYHSIVSLGYITIVSYKIKEKVHNSQKSINELLVKISKTKNSLQLSIFCEIGQSQTLATFMKSVIVYLNSYILF